MSRKNQTGSIEFEELQGNNVLILRRDWAMRKKGDLPDTEKCPFCDSKHRHGAGEGHRTPHCESGAMSSYTTDDGTVLRQEHGYILRDVNRLSPPAG